MTERGWTLARAVVLAVAVAAVAPVSPLVLVAVPLAVLLLALRHDDWRAVGLSAFLLVAAFTAPPDGDRALWYAERGWAMLAGGGFVLAHALRERREVLPRALAGVGAGGVGLAAAGVLRPSLLPRLDWLLSTRLETAAMESYRWLDSVSGGSLVAGEAEEVLLRWIDLQATVHPALLALSTVAALGVGWYAVARLAGVGQALPPLREFRFDDGLVWLLVLGLAALVVPAGGEGISRAGANAALFMAGLYFVRGVGILFWVAGLTPGGGWTNLLWGVAAVLLYPLAAAAALLLGVTDTWIDVRVRLRS